MNDPKLNDQAGSGLAAASGSEFVFIDAASQPFLVKNGWLWRWHKHQKNFVSARKLVPGEEAYYRRFRIPDDQAAFYIPNTKITYGTPEEKHDNK